MTQNEANLPEHVPKVLIVDDSPDIHEVVRVRLKPENLELVHALDADTGLALTTSLQPDLLLLDLDLGGQSGIDLCRRIKDDPDLVGIPVIFLTGTVDIGVKVQAFDAGAIDYITKPFDAIELRARVRAALRTKRFQDLLATRAQLDGMTGLWNRAYFDDRLAEESAIARRHGRPLALIMLDVDHFKQLNDGYGHPFGDQVLGRLAQALRETVRQSEIPCRYGGEEFAIILRETPLIGALDAAERIRVAIEAMRLSYEGKPVRITASLGVSAIDGLSNPTEFTPLDLLTSADVALYQAKGSGRNRVCGPSQTEPQTP